MNTSNWAATVQPGQIVMFRFPRAEDGAPGKARPCLVLAVNRAGADAVMTLAYGTSADTPANRGLDLLLERPQDWQAAGLHRESRFVLARKTTAWATDRRFVAGCEGTPVIGILPQEQLGRLRLLMNPSVITEPVRAYRAPARTSRRTIRGSGRGKQVLVIERRRRPAGQGRSQRDQTLLLQAEILQIQAKARRAWPVHAITKTGETRCGDSGPSLHCHQP